MAVRVVVCPLCCMMNPALMRQPPVRALSSREAERFLQHMATAAFPLQSLKFLMGSKVGVSGPSPPLVDA